MRLTATLVAISLTCPLAAAQAPEASPARNAAAAEELRARGDALRKQGDYQGALQAYEAARAASGEDAEVWKRIGWTLKAMRRFEGAARALERAVALDPGDREAKDDLEGLKASRGLTLRAWVGGTEPGTSKNAFEGQLGYGGLDRLELHAGGSWTDNIFYEAVKGYADGYWFYSPDSYARADFTFRDYRYTGASRPTPDSNAYETVPRGEVEISHWFAGTVRAGLDYQLFAPNFFFDKSTRIVNHKLGGELELRLGGGLSAVLMAAVLRDPDPKQTTIVGRPDPTVAQPPPPTPPVLATETRVAYRAEFLLGGGLAYEADRWGAGVKLIPNRDLDSGFDWSIISSLDLRPGDRLSLSFIWILDRYSTDAGPTFAGKKGNIYWGQARYQVTPALAMGGGLKWVQNPSQRSTTSTAARNDPTLLLTLEYRTGLF